MKWTKILKMAGLITALSLTLTACSTADSTYSPQQIIDQALQQTEKATTYYGEYTMNFSDETGIITAKEWIKDSQRRIEMTSEKTKTTSTVVNDGKELKMYDEETNLAYIMPLAEDFQSFEVQSPREQAEQLLNIIKDSHEITVEGEEKVAGRDAYHIIATAKEDNTLIGDQELWIDKKTWITLKSISTSGDFVATIEYTKIDTNAAIEDDTFVYTFPEGVDVEVMDAASTAPKEVTLEDAKGKIDAFLMIPETASLKITTIEDMNVEERPEFSINYAVDGIPAFSLSFFEETESYTEFGGLSSDEESITIHGQKGTKTDMEGFRLLNWGEGKLRYSVLIENPDITFEEVLSYIDTMELAE